MASEHVGEVGDSTFKAQVLESKEPVLVDFWATWCGPCRAIAPAVEDLAKSYTGKIKVFKLNVDDHQATAQQFGIRALPTLLMFKDGRVVDQIVGAVAKGKIEDSIKKAL
ncbi:MAG: thioredoxin [Myxococcales bacterium]